MHPSQNVRVKICCISSIEEAQLAITHGASALGLVSAMPSGPGPIAEEIISGIVTVVPPPVATFLLTSKQDIASIIDQQRRLGANTIQIVDRLERGTHADLRNALPGVKIVQVIHVSEEESLREAEAIAPYVDAILLDSGNQSLTVKELGGTGRTHDWTISRRIREAVDVPVFLAGGLNAVNVRTAIEAVGPFAVDVCSGVRTHGKLDAEKLAAFFDVVHRALSVRIHH
ncbi:MAG: phosphoribosylanthranilate isomerase [Bacteroidota bacterium]